MQGELKKQGTASINIVGESEKVKNGHSKELEKERAPLLQEQGGDVKKRKHEQALDPELPSVPFLGENQALKRCKQEFIEEGHAVISAVEAVAQCSICSDTMNQASTVSGCGHTFCRSCSHIGCKSSQRRASAATACPASTAGLWIRPCQLYECTNHRRN